jgi:hypothetical protein
LRDKAHQTKIYTRPKNVSLSDILHGVSHIKSIESMALTNGVYIYAEW